MVRIKRGKVAAKRRRSFLKLAKGYVGVNSRLSIFATEQIIQCLNYAYKGRKLKKDFFVEFGLVELMLQVELDKQLIQAF